MFAPAKATGTDGFIFENSEFQTAENDRQEEKLIPVKKFQCCLSFVKP